MIFVKIENMHGKFVYVNPLQIASLNLPNESREAEGASTEIMLSNGKPILTAMSPVEIMGEIERLENG